MAHGLALILGCLNDLILFKLAGKDMHKILDEMEFQPDSPTFYIIYMFQCFETPDMGSGIFTFLCFSLFQNVSKQLSMFQ